MKYNSVSWNNNNFLASKDIKWVMTNLPLDDSIGCTVITTLYMIGNCALSLFVIIKEYLGKY